MVDKNHGFIIRCEILIASKIQREGEKCPLIVSQSILTRKEAGMDTGQTKREEAIQQLVEEQEQLLRGLLSLIDTLVDRNPTESKPDVAQKHDNVFDEIIYTLHQCRGLITDATVKVQEGIIRKVY